MRLKDEWIIGMMEWAGYSQEQIKEEIQKRQLARTEKLRSMNRAKRRRYYYRHGGGINAIRFKARCKNPSKRWANKVAQRAVAKGKIIKPETCSACGVRARLDGHHENYSKPLDVTWLCHACHSKGHALSRKNVSRIVSAYGA